MKRLIAVMQFFVLLAVLLLTFPHAAHAALGGKPLPDGTRPAKPYFETIFRDPSHPKIGAGVLYTPSFEFDGGVTDVALVYHKADPDDTLWPQKLLDLGMPPVSWTLLEVGGGGNRESAFIHGGTSINLAPTVLGPLTAALGRAGGTAAKIGAILIAPDGHAGVRFGVGWKANVIRNGGFERLNQLRFPPRYGVGYVYQFQ